MKRFLKRLAVVLGLLALIGAIVGKLAYKAYVVDDPGPGYTRDEIQAVIAQESPVTYRDGKTPLGVFFDSEHRSYVSYTDLPQDWVHAIVAAEDGNFFKHPGFDPKHIIRAAWQNIVAGHVVAGGSTLSQQTAKNLFYRPDRSWKAKFAEATNTLRLEAHFSKEDILEFYANQFHVSANGRGIGIAARYFFDKTPKELTTKECAFIAGLVKAPSRYNPFVGESEDRRAAARVAAEERTEYVLRRMFEEGYIDERTLSRLDKEPLAFRHGTFQYDRSVVLDEVQRELDSQTFVDLFARLGIDNPSTAGIRITTTLDANTQREAVYGLWHHLTELGPKLERKTPADLQLPDRTQMSIEPGVPLARHGFYSARVTAAGDDSVTLDVGSRPCTVDKEGLERIAAVLGVKAADIPPAVPVGAFVLTSVRVSADPHTDVQERAGPGGGAQCDLEIRPALQGAVVVLDEGNVRAMVGGNDNRNFNRAMSAERQFGSTWKPILYMAAMQLGWTATDTLDNRRNVFPFRDVWYYPHPDHASDPYLPLTLVGARSENLASIWLLHHLTDRLNAEQFRQLADAVGFGGPSGIQRARDVEAIRSSPERYPEYAFQIAREDVLSGLAFGAHPEDALALRSLQYGRGFAAERARVLATASSPERAARLEALDANLLSLEELVSRCVAGDQLYQDPLVGTLACGAPPEGWEAVTGTGAATLPVLTGDVLVDGRIHLSTVQEVRRVLDTRVAELAGKDPWSMDALALNPDFRILVGIRYVAKLAEAFGVKSDLPTVMSLPLGAADITLLDAASMYQGMLKGEHYTFPGEGFEDGAVPGLRSNFAVPAMDIGLIAEIRDSGGNVLYRATGKAEPVADPVSGELTGDILRNVVKMGTGRRAYGAIKVGNDPVVTVGKTGTTNEYKNVAFVGMVPRSGSAGHWGEAYTIAAYVGYDDNHPMKRGSFKVQGASGALPVWIATARGMAEAGLLDSIAEYVPSAGLIRVPVPAATGMDSAPDALVPENGQRRFALLTQPATLTAATIEAAPEPVAPPTEPVEVPPDLAPAEPSVWDGL